MPFLLSFFVPTVVPSSMYQDEMNQLINTYSSMTGGDQASEEIWGLSGIYTPYGTDEYGNPSTKYDITDDGWIYGQKIGRYNPTQYNAEYDKDKDEYREDITGLDEGRLGYVVYYNQEKHLYYYHWVGSDLAYDKDSGNAGGIKEGDLYTRVHMDTNQKSTIFITHGGKHEMGNGTFYYDYTGYRYSFVPLSDYNYSRDMKIDQKTSSCSLIWYAYGSDSGLAGQLVISGTDQGVQYINQASIVQQFDQSTSTAKFTLHFSGVDTYVYIMLDPYALNVAKKSIEDCYNEGYWSLMVTTPKYVSAGNSDGAQISWDIYKMWNQVVGLFTFHPENYGLQPGSIGGYVASIVFVMPLYAQLIALGTIFWPILLIQGVLGQIQVGFLSGILSLLHAVGL